MTYTLERVIELTGLTLPEHPRSWVYEAYLGDGRFDKNLVDQIISDRAAVDTFVKETHLFIEYLNKIEEIPYAAIARKVGIATSNLSTFCFGPRVAARIVGSFHKYVKNFEKYYNKEPKDED